MKLSDKCRLCLIKSSINSDEIFFPIDSSFEKKFSEITKLQFVKPQSAEELKRFPDKVCMQCVSELEHHYNYRNSLIEKQKRLNILLGKEEEIQKVLEQAEQEQYLDTEALQSEDDDGLEETIDSHDINTVASPGKSYEEESEEMKEPETDKINSEYEAEYTVESYDGYEQIEEHEEDIYEEQETLTSVSEVIVDSLDEENQNHAIDDKEENYDIEVESDDYLCIIKNEGASDTEGEYDVVYEDDITVQEKPIYNKRKYTKQSKDSPNQFKCWIRNCGSTFAFRSTMKKHMHQTHSIVCDKSTCFICGDRYDNYADFLAHVKCHTRKTECDVCKLTFVNEEKLEGHKNKFHKNNDGERKFKCHICSARFKRKEHVNSHIVYKHSDKNARKFLCQECPSTFLTRQDQKNHEKSHSQVKIKCVYCLYECRDLKSIKRHCSKIHRTSKIYKCTCDETFVLFRELQSHKKLCAGTVLLNT